MIFRKSITAFSLLTASLFACDTVSGCGPFNFDPYAYNPFKVIAPIKKSWGGATAKAQDETISFWRAYTGGAVTYEEITSYFENADAGNLYPEDHSELIRHLERKGDKVAIGYIRDCLEFNRLSDRFESSGWEYDERNPVELREFAKLIANRNGGKVFGPRYQLLRMRIAGVIHDDTTIMAIWESTGAKMRPSPLRDRMGGFVGGVLYRQKKYPEALDYFYESGDNNSISWCVSKIVGPDNLRNLYDHAPNSTATLYALNDYINYLIAQTEAGRDEALAHVWEDEREAVKESLLQRKDFIKMCDGVIDGSRCDYPMAWAIAKGILQLTMGKTTDGLATLTNVRKLSGTEIMRSSLDNFELWALMLNSGKGDDSLDRRMIEALETVYRNAVAESLEAEKMRFSKRYEDRINLDEAPYYSFLTTFFTREAEIHFKNVGKPQWALAVMAMMDDLPISPQEDSGIYLNDLRNSIFKDLDKKAALAFIELAENSADNEVDRYFGKYAALYRNVANEAYGTRLLYADDFAGALKYLEKVPSKWLPTMAIYPYLNRYSQPYYTYSFGRTVKGAGRWSPYYPINVKALFCNQMINDMREYDSQTGNERAEIAYRIAATYHYASPQGDCWAISDYAWSISNPTNEFNERSKEWLMKALDNATDPRLRCRIFYAILQSPSTDRDGNIVEAFGYTTDNDGMIRYYWNNHTNLYRQAADYLMTNYDVVRQDYYMSQCDVLQDYAANRFVAKPRYNRY